MRLSAGQLELRLQSPAEVREWIETLPPEVRVELSPAWLARLDASTGPNPWTCGFEMIEPNSGVVVGTCAFVGPPDENGEVEIAYGVNEEHRGRGYATIAAVALAAFARTQPDVRTVRAHTKPNNPASDRVLEKAGFQRAGEVQHPEDGLVTRWVFVAD